MVWVSASKSVLIYFLLLHFMERIHSPKEMSIFFLLSPLLPSSLRQMQLCESDNFFLAPVWIPL